MSHAIQLKNLTAGYQKKPVLHDVSLTVEEASIHIIIGPSGAGKTTVLKAINGLIQPIEGEVHIFERRLLKEYRPQFGSLIGYVPQNLGLIETFTALDNVLLGALSRISTIRSILNMFPQEERAYGEALLDALGMRDKKDSLVYRLSGGEKRRVAIARALMQKPKILLADEILSDINSMQARSIIQKLKAVQKDAKLTILMVEHNICTAKEIGDQITVMQKGRLADTIPKGHLSDQHICKWFT